MCLKSRAVYICFTLPPRGLIVWSGVDWVERQMRRRLSPWGQNQSGFPILGKALRRPFHLNSQQLGLLKHQLSLVRYIVLPGDVTGRLCRTPASSLAVCYRPRVGTDTDPTAGQRGKTFLDILQMLVSSRSPGRACYRGADGVAEVVTGAVAASIVLGSVSCRLGLIAELSCHHTALRRRLLHLGFALPFLSVA